MAESALSDGIGNVVFGGPESTGVGAVSDVGVLQAENGAREIASTVATANQFNFAGVKECMFEIISRV